MTIIAVDDEPAALWALERAIRGAAQQAELASFSSVKEALAYAQSHPIDAAFLDIHMSEMNGLLCAKLLKDIRSATNIIFVSGYSRYRASAFDMHASGYVLKPIDDARVREELENLRQPSGRRRSPGSASSALAALRSSWITGPSCFTAPRRRRPWPTWWTGRGPA